MTGFLTTPFATEFVPAELEVEEGDRTLEVAVLVLGVLGVAADVVTRGRAVVLPAMEVRGAPALKGGRVVDVAGRVAVAPAVRVAAVPVGRVAGEAVAEVGLTRAAVGVAVEAEGLGLTGVAAVELVILFRAGVPATLVRAVVVEGRVVGRTVVPLPAVVDGLVGFGVVADDDMIESLSEALVITSDPNAVRLACWQQRSSGDVHVLVRFSALGLAPQEHG